MKRGLITTGLRAEFIHNTAGSCGDYPLTLLWHDTDPHMVVFDFGSGQRVVDRDLFYAGLQNRRGSEPSGIGDVRVWPWRSDDGLTVVAVSSPDGSASFLVPTGACLRFLTGTYQYTPADVDLTPDVDAFIASVLDGASS